MKYNDNESIDDSLLNFEKAVRQLKAIGAKSEETDLICQLMVTLPSSFDPLVTALQTLKPVTRMIKTDWSMKKFEVIIEVDKWINYLSYRTIIPI